MCVLKTLTMAAVLAAFAACSGAFAANRETPAWSFSPVSGGEAPADAPKASDDQRTDPPGGSGGQKDLAKQLQNPISSLISVPLQYNLDFNAGPDDDGERHTLNIQPVVPIAISEAWNLIIRTIVPVIYQDGLVDDGGLRQFGLGDTVQSFFFSPKAPGPGGLIWGVGPVFLWPTGTNDSLGSEQWGIGPTTVLLWQKGPWTYGVLANHIWSYAGDDNRGEISATFVQPFLSHTDDKAFTVGVNTESTYDWQDDQWTIPVNLFASQLVKFDKQPVSFTFGGRYYAENPDNGPEWGVRFVVTFLFPK